MLVAVSFPLFMPFIISKNILKSYGNTLLHLYSSALVRGGHSCGRSIAGDVMRSAHG